MVTLHFENPTERTSQLEMQHLIFPLSSLVG